MRDELMGGPKAKNLLLTGRPGVGKTTLLERAAKGLAVPVGGFYTREIREKGVRVGFRLMTWGERAVLSALESRVPLLGVIQARPHPFLEGVRRRSDVQLFPVTVENRDRLVTVLQERLRLMV